MANPDSAPHLDAGEDPIVLVTGAAAGIGRTTAELFSERGHRVVGLDRHWTVTPAFPTVTADLSMPQDYAGILAAIEGEHGAVGVLVNNAGLYLGRNWEALTSDDITKVLAVNVQAPLLLSQAAAVSMRTRSRGVIINVASISARSPGHDPIYAASKAALVAMTTALSSDLAPFGIRVNAVAPGLIQTAMTDVIPSNVRTEYHTRVPLGRFGSPLEVAEVITFLASPAASYVAGAIVGIDGALR